MALARGELLREEKQDGKWPSSPAAAPGVHELSRELFHFFRMEPQVQSGTAGEPITKQSKTKERDGGVLPADFPDINALAVSRDGRRAFAGMSDGDLLELELSRTKKSLEIRRRTLMNGGRAILAVALSPDERFIALARFGLVEIYDRFKESRLFQLTKLETRLMAIDWDPRSELVLIGGVGGEIYTWNIFDGPGAGRDTQDAVERYEGNAPVVKLLFHPSARAFFAAQQDGRIVFWRLLRTERELGLRDDAALIDWDKRGSTSTFVGLLPGRPESLWLEPGGDRLFVSASDGKLYRWKVRGLEKQAEISIGVDTVAHVGQLPFIVRDRKGGSALFRPFYSSGRGQRLTLHCPKIPDQKLNQSAVSVVPSNPLPLPTPGAVLLDGRIEEPESPPAVETSANSGVSIASIASSDRLDSPLQITAAGTDSAVLWAVQKGGTLVVFDATQLRLTKWFEKELHACLAQPGSI